MANCLISLGSNLGDRSAQILDAIRTIDLSDGITVQSTSSLLQTEPVGGPDGQSVFLNAAAVLQTSHSAQVLLDVLLEIESRLGRIRKERWGERSIDIDILLYDDQIVQTDSLSIPHPRLAVRRFVLEPAVQIAADWKLPKLGWTLNELYQHLLHAPPRFAFPGIDWIGRQDLVEQVAKLVAAKVIASRSAAEQKTPADWGERSFEEQLQCARDVWMRFKHPDWQCQPFAANSAAEQPVLAASSELDQMVLAEMTLSQNSASSFQTQLTGLQLAKPKLCILLRNLAGAGDFFNEFQQRYAERLMQSSACPIYCVDGSDENWLVHECAAAIESMR